MFGLRPTPRISTRVSKLSRKRRPMNSSPRSVQQQHLPWWKNRWLGLVTGIWLQACGGCSYNFGLYSQSIKSNLGYSQETLDALGTAKDIGGNVGIISGFLYAVWPPWAVVLVGAFQTTFGYLGLWLAATGRIPQPPFWQMALLIMVGTNGATFFNTAVLVTCVRNFPGSRGVVVGLLKGFIGLSGAIFTQIYTSLYAPDQTAFLLLVAWAPSLVALLALFFVHPLDRPAVEAEETERTLFAVLYVVGGGVAAYLMAIILGKDLLGWQGADSLGVTFLMLLLLVGLLAAPWYSMREGALHAADSPDERLPLKSESLGERAGGLRSDAVQTSAVRSAVLTKRHHPLPGAGGGAETEPELGADSQGATGSREATLEVQEGARGPEPSHGDDYSVAQALQSVEFWLLFSAMVCGSGSGLAAINNLGQMGHSLGYSQDSIAACVSLISIWNFLGRLGGGVVSEHMLKTRSWPRPIFMVITQCVMGLGHLLYATAAPGSLYLGSIITGVTYGVQWSVMPAAASELFGLKSFAVLYNIFASANPIGSYLLSVCLAGYIYDQEAEKERKHGDEISKKALMCHGSHCFRFTFIIMSMVCVLGASLSATLTFRTRHFYSMISKKDVLLVTQGDAKDRGEGELDD